MKGSREIIRTAVHEIDTSRSVEMPVGLADQYSSYPAQMTEGLQLLDYWRAVRKRLWLVLGITVLFTTLAAIYMARKPDIYRARAVVQVDLEQTNPDVMTGDRQRTAPNSDPAYINTQLQLLWSDSLLRRVIKDHNLDANKDLQKDRGEMSTSSWRSHCLAGLQPTQFEFKNTSSRCLGNFRRSSEEIAERFALHSL